MSAETKEWIINQAKDAAGLASMIALISAITLFCINYAPQNLPV